MSRIIPSFTIEIDRVFLHKQVHGQPCPVEKEFIRGDLVLGMRTWHKSSKDNEMIEGEMCEVTVRDPANDHLRVPHQKYQLAESAESFNERLKKGFKEAEQEFMKNRERKNDDRDPSRHATAE